VNAAHQRLHIYAKLLVVVGILGVVVVVLLAYWTTSGMRGDRATRSCVARMRSADNHLRTVWTMAHVDEEDLALITVESMIRRAAQIGGGDALTEEAALPWAQCHRDGTLFLFNPDPGAWYPDITERFNAPRSDEPDGSVRAVLMVCLSPHCWGRGEVIGLVYGGFNVSPKVECVKAEELEWLDRAVRWSDSK
jgi:hypothetical protein